MRLIELCRSTPESGVGNILAGLIGLSVRGKISQIWVDTFEKFLQGLIGTLDGLVDSSDRRDSFERWLGYTACSNLQTDKRLKRSNGDMEVCEQSWLNELRPTLIKFLIESKVAVKKDSIDGSKKVEEPGERLSLVDGSDRRECFERWLSKTARANLVANSLLEWSTAVIQVSEKC